MQPEFSKLVYFLLFAGQAALVFNASCGKVPEDRSALYLVIDGAGDSIESGLVYVDFYSDGVGMERWGFLTGGKYPYEFEIWTRLEGEYGVGAEGYICPGSGCRDADGRAELLETRWSGNVTLRHGRKARLDILLEKICGGGTIDENEECDDGGPDPGDGCLPDCSYPFMTFRSGAGGPDDSFTAFALGPGFAAAWTGGAGDEVHSPDLIYWMRFDENGVLAAEAPSMAYLPSCMGEAGGVFSTQALSSAGAGGAGALLLWAESMGEGSCALCLSRIDESGLLSGPLAIVESAAQWHGKIAFEMVGISHVAVISRQEGEFLLHVVETVEPPAEAGRTVMDDIDEGEEVSTIRLRAAGEDLLAAAWQEKTGERVVSKIRRWSLGSRREPIPLDTTALVIGEEESGTTSEVGLGASPSAPHRMVVARISGGGLETVWIDGDEGVEEFETEIAPLELPSGSWIAGAEMIEEGSVHLLVGSPGRGEGDCTFRLVRIGSPGSGGELKDVEAWGTGEEPGCDGELLRLSHGRAAVIFRRLKAQPSGEIEGELSLDIAR